jgi:hypothetical protein
MPSYASKRERAVSLPERGTSTGKAPDFWYGDCVDLNSWYLSQKELQHDSVNSGNGIGRLADRLFSLRPVRQ